MENLGALCQSESFLRTKIALLSFYNKRCPQWFEIALLMLEYLQLMSQGLFLYLETSSYNAETDPSVFSSIISFFRLINPSHLFTFQKDSSVISTILLIVLGLTILKYLLAVYIVSTAFWNGPKYNVLINIWKFIFKTQSRIICFIVTSFWVQTILSYSNEDFSLYGMNQPLVTGICVILIVIEYMFSFFLKTQFFSVLPNKNFLSSKNYRTQIGTLAQKLALQMLQFALNSQSQINVWAYTTINLGLSVIKQFTFYHTLPLYSLKALFYQADLLSLVTSLNLTCFIQALLVQADYQTSKVDTLIILWIIFFGLIAKTYRHFMHTKITDLVIGNQTQYPSHLLVHKIKLSKELRKMQELPAKRSQIYDFTYLLSITEDISTAKGDSNYDMSLKYLENLSTRFPEDTFIKLFLARQCSKSPNLCVKATKIISELKLKKWSKSYLSAILLQHKIQNMLERSHQKNEEDLDILRYIQSQIFVEQLKKEMLYETDLKVTICNNILSETSNIGKIHSCAQLIDKSKKNIEKKINFLAKKIPDYFTEPLLLSAVYHLILNYSFSSFEKLSNLYAHKQVKYNKSFQEPSLNNENFYQDSNIFLVLSGQKQNNGQIALCSNSIQKLCGGQRKSYYGSHISALFTQSFQSFYTYLIKQITETGQGDFLEKRHRAFIYHKDGYIVETELFLSIHPYLTRGLYLNMIIRPVPIDQEYMLIKENGDIEGMTKRIRKILGMNTSATTTINLRMFSEELYKANAAFNVACKFQQSEGFISTNHSKITTKHTNIQEEFSSQVDYSQALELHKYIVQKAKLFHYYL